LRLSLILTKTPRESPMLEKCVELGLFAGSEGFTIAVYLVGNGVYCVKKGENASDRLKKISESRGEVFVRREDLEARGLDTGDIISDAKIPPDFYGQMIVDIMERSDRVITV
jgi:sulfur relay protein TusB/DsrH